MTVSCRWYHGVALVVYTWPLTDGIQVSDPIDTSVSTQSSLTHSEVAVFGGEGSQSRPHAAKSVRQRFFEMNDAFRGSAVPPSRTRHPMWHFEVFRLYGSQVWVCSLSLFLAGILCSAGGIGGGGVYVTVLMVAGGLEISDAVPLSKAIVFFGSIASLILNLRKSFSTEEKTKESLVDFNICRLVVPASLGGTYIGVFLNRVLPGWIVGLVLCVILLGITIMVGKTTWNQYWDESDSCKSDGPSESAPASTSGKQVESGSATASGHPQQAVRMARVQTHFGPSLKDALQGKFATNERRYSWHGGPLSPHQQALEGKPAGMRGAVESKDAFFALTVLFVVVLFSSFRFHAGACQHATAETSQELCHHPAFVWLGRDTLERWMHDERTAEFLSIFAFVSPLAMCAAVVAYYSRSMIDKQGWVFKEVLLYDTIAVLTGVLAGLVGIGGGLIISPFLLFMNLEPAVAVATSSTCVIFTSSSTTLQYLLSDRIIMSLTVLYGLVNLVASYAGTSFVHLIQERLSRRWYISAIVGTGVLLSTALALIHLLAPHDGQEAH